MTSITDRLKKSFFDGKKDSAVLIISEENRFYLTGFESSDGVVLVTENEQYLIVDFRYYEIAKTRVKDFTVLLSDRPMLEIVKDLCAKHCIKSVYTEDDYVTVSLNNRIVKILSDCEICYIGNAISNLRAVKTVDEINKIKNAQILTDAAFDHILEFLQPGLTEAQVAAEIDHYMRLNGAQGSAFKTICVSGKKSSLPHGEPENVALTENSFLTMDFGARLDGYCADMTRTVVLGKATDEMISVYNTVLAAQLKALSEIRAGVKGSDVDKAARDVIEKAGYGQCFGHSTGHGLGIEVHESPSYSPKYDKEIPLNAVLSIEPGIYIEGKFGVRIEDIAVVKEDGILNLTQSTKKLIEIQ